MDLAVEVYGLSGGFPSSERYRLTDQITRSAVSVAANIAEGHAKGTSKEFAHGIAIARGSLMETETYLMLAVRLGYLTETNVAGTLGLVTDISKMATVLQRNVLASNHR